MGYQRIVGECRKLDVRVSATSVGRILRRLRLGPAPRRSGPSWTAFLRAQAGGMLACDFLTVETIPTLPRFLQSRLSSGLGPRISSSLYRKSHFCTDIIRDLAGACGTVWSRRPRCCGTVSSTRPSRCGSQPNGIQIATRPWTSTDRQWTNRAYMCADVANYHQPKITGA